MKKYAISVEADNGLGIVELYKRGIEYYICHWIIMIEWSRCSYGFVTIDWNTKEYQSARKGCLPHAEREPHKCYTSSPNIFKMFVVFNIIYRWVYVFI